MATKHSKLGWLKSWWSEQRYELWYRIIEVDNLNDLGLVEGDLIEDPSTASDNGLITCYFRDLESNLIHYINEADMVVGCVAWLTSERINSRTFLATSPRLYAKLRG